MSEKNLNEMTVIELRKLAKELHVPLRAGISKQGIVECLTQTMATAAPAEAAAPQEPAAPEADKAEEAEEKPAADMPAPGFRQPAPAAPRFNTKPAYQAPAYARRSGKGLDVDAIDALSLAEAAGSSKAVNIVLMGRLSKYFDIPAAEWLTAIEASVPAKFLELNKKAFQLGLEA